MKTVITQKQKGLKFKNGRFVELLTSGKYRTFGDTTIEVRPVEHELFSNNSTLGALLDNPDVARAVDVVEVGDNQLAFHYTDGRLSGVLPAGKYAFWKDSGVHSFSFADISTPYVSDDIPDSLFAKIPACFYEKVEVAEHQKARLYFNRKFVKLLDAGTHYFWRCNVNVSAELVDTRLLQLDITGQEMLTQDKVTLRINFVCNYKITDYVKIATGIDNYQEQLHVAAQLALRDYVGKHRLDDILENKQAISEVVFENLKAKENTLFINVSSADVKDIILPGEIRDIMNTVLVAEKKAQANVITRREEVASTRSLLNTAKLMEENPTLYRLKELEYVERICQNVGNINVNGFGDLLSQLTKTLKS